MEQIWYAWSLCLRKRNRYLIYRFNSEFADVLAEFLEVAIHQIMYVREVYPRGTPCAHSKTCIVAQVD